MFLYDPDLVPFNGLHNVTLFKKYERYKRYCWDNFQNLPGYIRILFDLTYQVSYVLCG